MSFTLPTIPSFKIKPFASLPRLPVAYQRSDTTRVCSWGLWKAALRLALLNTEWTRTLSGSHHRPHPSRRAERRGGKSQTGSQSTGPGREASWQCHPGCPRTSPGHGGGMGRASPGWGHVPFAAPGNETIKGTSPVHLHSSLPLAKVPPLGEDCTNV